MILGGAQVLATGKPEPPMRRHLGLPKRALTMPRAALVAAISALRGSKLGEDLAHGASHGQPDVGVDVDLAHTGLDATLDLFDRHAIGLQPKQPGSPSTLRPTACENSHTLRLTSTL